MKNNKYIPFNSIHIPESTIGNINEAILNDHISGDGPFTKLCNEFLERQLVINKSLITTSCTHAMEMAAILLNVKDGDEIIVPSYTFVSSINPFILRGAVPRFVDIREDTLNMDEDKILGLVNKKTKAIVPVHYAGVGCEMDDILEIAQLEDISVIEDNAHGLFGKYKGKFLGSFGKMSTQSFHETKNFTCGEGGALLINSTDEEFIERAEIIREKGTNRTQFFRGDVHKYEWIDVGSSYLPSEILAAFLYSQFQNKDFIQTKRAELWKLYYKKLKDWAEINNIRLPFVPDYCEQAFHMFYMIMPSSKSRDLLIEYLTESGIKSVFHYLPLHNSQLGKKFNVNKNLQVTEELSSRIIRLPFFTDLNLNDVDFEILYNFKT